jgi:16S rRNA (adenine1518-N6/adenine1519-N6)-dimethyltransferase
VTARGRRPRWGQNFLVDTSVARAMVDWAAVDGRDVLEIGPGRGALTSLLAPRARRLVLVEIDPALAAALRERYRASASVEIVETDVLRVDLAALAGADPFVVVASLPYESGTAIVRRLVEAPAAVREAVVMLQKEVCERMTAAPGSKAYGALTIHMALRADVEAGRVVGPACFRPRPQVDSQILRIRPLPVPRWEIGDARHFEAIVREAFGARRKMLRNTLERWLATRADAQAAASALARAGIDASARAETVPPDAFARLSALTYRWTQERARAS